MNGAVPRCSETREGDELVCYAPGCHLRWDTHEARPDCPMRQHERYEWPDVKGMKCT